MTHIKERYIFTDTTKRTAFEARRYKDSHWSMSITVNGERITPWKRVTLKDIFEVTLENAYILIAHEYDVKV